MGHVNLNTDNHNLRIQQCRINSNSKHDRTIKTIKIRCYIEYAPTLDQNDIHENVKCIFFFLTFFYEITKFLVIAQGHCLNNWFIYFYITKKDSLFIENNIKRQSGSFENYRPRLQDHLTTIYLWLDKFH